MKQSLEEDNNNNPEEKQPEKGFPDKDNDKDTADKAVESQDAKPIVDLDRLSAPMEVDSSGLIPAQHDCSSGNIQEEKREQEAVNKKQELIEDSHAQNTSPSSSARTGNLKCKEDEASVIEEEQAGEVRSDQDEGDDTTSAVVKSNVGRSMKKERPSCSLCGR